MIDADTLAALLARGACRLDPGPPAMVTTYDFGAGAPRSYPGKDLSEALRRALAATTTREGTER